MAINTQVKRATLFDPASGKRVAVDVGGQQSRDLFAKGFKLETNISQTPYAAAPVEQQRQLFSDIHAAPAGPGQIGTFQGGYQKPRQLTGLEMPDAYNMAASGQPQAAQPTQPSQPATSPAQTYHDAMANILKQMQGGLTGTDEDLQKQRNQLIQARFQAQADITPEGLRMLTPEQQSALRAQDVRGMETQLGGVSAALRSREAGRKEARDFLSEFNKQNAPQYKDINGNIVQIDPMTGEAQTIYSAPTEQKSIEIDGNLVRYNPETKQYEKVYQGQKDIKRDTSVVEAGGRKVLIDNQTGDIIKELGADAVTGKTSSQMIDIGGIQYLMTHDDNGNILNQVKLGAKGGITTTVDANGNIITTPGKAPTDAERIAAGFYNRLLDANAVFKSIESQITKYNPVWYTAQKVAPNMFKNPVVQQQEQAERNFVNAILRRESGAVISKEEFANAALQYFPQPGDSAEVLEQKKKNRETVTNNMQMSAGNALQNNQNNDPLGIDFNSVDSDTKRAVGKVFSKLLSYADNATGGQCGKFVNKLTGLGVGDNYKSKITKMDPSIKYPAPGMVFTMPYKDTGHVGFILAVNDDGTAIVRDSNYGLDEKIKTHEIAISKMTGFARV